MGLSEEQKAILAARYDTWGLDRVRLELARDDRRMIAHPDVTAFAEEWVAAQEHGQRRAWKSVAVLVIIGAIQVGLVIALLVDF